MLTSVSTEFAESVLESLLTRVRSPASRKQAGKIFARGVALVKHRSLQSVTMQAKKPQGKSRQAKFPPNEKKYPETARAEQAGKLDADGQKRKSMTAP